MTSHVTWIRIRIRCRSLGACLALGIALCAVPEPVTQLLARRPRRYIGKGTIVASTLLATCHLWPSDPLHISRNCLSVKRINPRRTNKHGLPLQPRRCWPYRSTPSPTRTPTDRGHPVFHATSEPDRPQSQGEEDVLLRGRFQRQGCVYGADHVSGGWECVFVQAEQGWVFVIKWSGHGSADIPFLQLSRTLGVNRSSRSNINS